MKLKIFIAAVHSYSAGLQAVTDAEPDLRRDLLRNRAQAHILVHHYDAAITDALASLSNLSDGRSKALDGKALFRAAQAAYQLEDYPAAEAHLLRQIKLMPEDSDGHGLLERTRARLREQSTGEYNIEAIAAGLTPTRPRADIGTYVGKIEVKDTGTAAGRGVYATHDITNGELVLCEKAICAVFGQEPRGEASPVQIELDDRKGPEGRPFNFGLWKALVHKVTRNSSLLPKLTQLAGMSNEVEPDVAIVDGQPAIDAFRLHDIAGVNAYMTEIPDPEKITSFCGLMGTSRSGNGLNAGLWVQSSYFNHACLPNSHRIVLGDMLIVRATRPIRAGEEITQGYLNPDTPDRADVIKHNWNFVCACALCVAERSDGPSELERRLEATVAAATFIPKKLAQVEDAGPEIMSEARSVLRNITSTYPREAYHNVALTGEASQLAHSLSK